MQLCGSIGITLLQNHQRPFPFGFLTLLKPSEFYSNVALLMCDGGRKRFQTSKSSQAGRGANLIACFFFCFTRRTLWWYWIGSKTNPTPKRTRDVERHRESHKPLFQCSPLPARVSLLVMDFLLRAHGVSWNSLGWFGHVMPATYKKKQAPANIAIHFPCRILSLL